MFYVLVCSFAWFDLFVVFSYGLCVSCISCVVVFMDSFCFRCVLFCGYLHRCLLICYCLCDLVGLRFGVVFWVGVRFYCRVGVYGVVLILVCVCVCGCLFSEFPVECSC